jgi:hypothetical protein
MDPLVCVLFAGHCPGGAIGSRRADILADLMGQSNLR